MCGHVVHAAFPMAGLPVCEAASGPLGEFLVRPGQTPSSLEGGVRVEGRADGGAEASPHEVLITVRDVGRILIRDGREIVVDARPGRERDIATFVLGSGLGCLCLQKGLLPLHASAVTRGGQALAFSGPSGAGKSTMAAAMTGHGYSHLSDDLSIVGLGGERGAEVYPGVPLVKLWPDSASAVGLDKADAKPELTWHAKLKFDMAIADAPEPAKLAAVYFLETEDRADIVIEPLVGPYAVAALTAEIYRRGWLAAMGRIEGAWRQIGRLSQLTACYRIRRPHDFERLDDVARMVADHHAALAAAWDGVA